MYCKMSVNVSILTSFASVSNINQPNINQPKPIKKLLFYRMFPVVPLNGRVVADKDVMIGGYQFSKNVSWLFLK